jgi:hypothetical protein
MALECFIHLVLQHQPLPEKLLLDRITTLLMSQCICYEFISQNKPIESCSLQALPTTSSLCITDLYSWECKGVTTLDINALPQDPLD